MEELNIQGGPSACLRLYFRLSGTVRQVYEPYRQGKESKSEAGRFLEIVLGGFASEEGKTLLDVSKLPVFDKLQPHFAGEGGVIVVSLDDGWAVTLSLPLPMRNP
jgi:hypothetical protein